MTGFRTFGPGEKKDDFGAATGIGRLTTGRTLSPRETTVELHSESADEACVSDNSKNVLVKSQRWRLWAEKSPLGQ
jgi:hypothetical protein